MEWFKFRMSWRKPLLMLTDEEAGRVIKALVTYIYSEEEQETGDRGDLLLCQMTEMMQEDAEQMKQKAEKKAELSRKRSEAGQKGARATNARAAKAKGPQLLPDDADACRDLPDDAEACCDLPDDADACRDLPEVAGACRNLPYKNKNTEYKNQNIRDSEKEKEGRYSDTEGEDGGSSSGPPPAVQELPVLVIPLVNGSEYPVYRRDVDGYLSLYPDVDVEQELRSMRGWCLANPTRRKTARGVKAFINSWLNKTQKEAAVKRAVPENPFLAYARGEKEIGDFML